MERGGGAGGGGPGGSGGGGARGSGPSWYAASEAHAAPFAQVEISVQFTVFGEVYANALIVLFELHPTASSL